MYNPLILILLCWLATPADIVYQTFNGLYIGGVDILGQLTVGTTLNLSMTCSKPLTVGFYLYRASVPSTSIANSTIVSTYVASLTFSVLVEDFYTIMNMEDEGYS